VLAKNPISIGQEKNTMTEYAIRAELFELCSRKKYNLCMSDLPRFAPNFINIGRE